MYIYIHIHIYMVPLTGRERERESEKEEGESFLFWFLDLRDSRALGGETTRLDRFQDYPLTGFSFVEALERVFWHKKVAHRFGGGRYLFTGSLLTLNAVFMLTKVYLLSPLMIPLFFIKDSRARTISWAASIFFLLSLLEKIWRSLHEENILKLSLN